MPRRLPLLILAAVFSLSPALRAQEAPRMPGRRRPGSCCPTAGPSRRPASRSALTDLPLNILPLRRRPARPGRHQRVQRPRARARRPREQEGRRSPGRPAELVRPGRRRPTSGGSGGRAAAANVVHSVPARGQRADADRARTRSRRRQRRKRHAARTHFRSGLALDRAAQDPLLARHRRRHDRRPRPRGRCRAIRSAPVGERPYDVALARNGTQLYVSDWAGRAVLRRRPGRPPDRRPGSPSASIPTRSPSIPRTTGSSSPAPRATASR